jgi:hypothetical protein
MAAEAGGRNSGNRGGESAIAAPLGGPGVCQCRPSRAKVRWVTRRGGPGRFAA